MRNVETKVYSYTELSEKAKEKAIRLLDDYYNSEIHYDIKDDCCLFDIKETEKTFNIKNGDNILFGNNRGDLFYSDNDSYINCTDSLVINDYDAFYIWLGLDKNIIKKLDNDLISLSIVGNSNGNYNYKNKTKLELNEIVYNCLTTKQLDKIDKAIAKFSYHIADIKERIMNEIEYKHSEAYFIDSELINEHEYLENGELYKGD